MITIIFFSIILTLTFPLPLNLPRETDGMVWVEGDLEEAILSMQRPGWDFKAVS